MDLSRFGTPGGAFERVIANAGPLNRCPEPLEGAAMKTRTLGPFTVSAIGFGCMSLSHAYGTPPDEATGKAVLNRALEVGHTFLDTAAIYGVGHNETLVGETLGHRRSEFTLASKCGIIRNEAGQREINGRPETIRRVCEESLKRLRTDVIDLYYLHRWDKRVPVEESVGTLGDLVHEGKIRTVGLSEVSAETLRKAHKEFPITAVQSEYSLWTRNPEIAVLEACRELGVTFVPFGPVGRGFLTGKLRAVDDLPATDIRKGMPRFQGENFEANLRLLGALEALAKQANCSLAQLAMAWVLAKGDDLVPIPGTSRIDHLEENAASADIELPPEVIDEMESVVNDRTVHGNRYSDQARREVDTEEFEAA
jgi:aryl-alcohol dehydrogenase-like predicted oxidoreductase